MSDARKEAGGVSAGWVVALVIALTLGLGTVFFVVANSHPVELVDMSSRVDPTADTKVDVGRTAPDAPTNGHAVPR